MAAYLTTAEFVSRYTEREARLLTDEAGTGAIDEARLLRGIDDATDTINGYLARRFLLPLQLASTGQAYTPEAIKRLCGDIARYFLTGTHVHNTDEIRTRYKDAIALLDKIAKGEVSLGADLVTASLPSAPVSGATAVRSGGRQFGDDTLSQVL